MPELILSILNSIGTALMWGVLFYFIYTVSYSFILSIAGYFYSTKPSTESDLSNKIVVFIPAYKEDEVIVEAAQEAISHNYPKEKFDVVVVADSLKQETLDRLALLDGLKVVEVKFDVSTKVKALNTAFRKLKNQYDIGVILDADNIMEEGFLANVSTYYSKGYLAIQGQRVAKNKNTSMAVLDGLSEAINNHIYREGTSALHLSCSFIGSGMAIDYKLMTSTLEQMDSVGGFDRDMEVKLVGKGVKVYYLKKAIVYDEKVENTKVFANQRKRWIYSQYNYLFKEFVPGIKQLLRGNLVYFNSAVLRNVQLPRLINIGLLFILAIISFFAPLLLVFPFTIWLSLLIVLVFSNVIAIPRSFYGKELLVAILSLPKVFFIMFLLLFKLRGSNKSFIHTPHNKMTK